jgi:hypothetical protein
MAWRFQGEGGEGGSEREGKLASLLFDCLDEVMSLSQGHWLRKHARVLLRRLLNITSFDLSVESKLLDMIQGFCEHDSLAASILKSPLYCEFYVLNVEGN